MINDENLCPCCSGDKYETCCEPFHNGELPRTAEQLMRSRYSAYALCLPKYLIETTHPSKRIGLSELEIIEWSKENKWVNLEIVSTSNSMVEFKATFMDPQGLIHVHHELSTFTSIKGQWYYVKGKFY